MNQFSIEEREPDADSLPAVVDAGYSMVDDLNAVSKAIRGESQLLNEWGDVMTDLLSLVDYFLESWQPKGERGEE